MASKVLYPAVVSDYQAAFIATSGNKNFCRVYFTLSKFNASSDFVTVQATVKKQDTGLSVVKKTENRITGIILNLTPVYDENLKKFYVDIKDEDLKSSAVVSNESYTGWIPGWIYKIQLRLSTVAYEGDNTSNSQYKWLNGNASSFSEWSTVCIVKCIGDVRVRVPGYNDFDSFVVKKNINKETTTVVSSLVFNGVFSSPIDTSEFLHSYELQLLDAGGSLLESSGAIYAERQLDEQAMNYVFKTQPRQNEDYIVRLTIITNNLYTKTYDFELSFLSSILNTNAEIAVLTIDGYYKEPYLLNPDVYSEPMSDIHDENSHTHGKDVKYYKTLMETYTSLYKEEEEGYICLKLYLAKRKAPVYNTNIIIRRSSSKDNFATWEDIKVIPFGGTGSNEESINDLPPYYDFTIESGVIYRYAVQVENKYGVRNAIYTAGQAQAVRYFEHSYLLGENGQQLKLKYDNTISAVKVNVLDQKVDPIGSQYAVITRNGNIYYKTIPIAGLVSFNMDDNELFITKDKLYGGKDIRVLSEEYDILHGVDSMYNFDYERLFRDEVIKFLYDGKPKLFKSPTEGNVIVRLMDVSFTPNQQVDRLVYSFTSNAHELDKYTFDNCVKWNFHSIGEASTDFVNTKFKLGQIRLLPMKDSNSTEMIGGAGTVPSGTDIVPLMFNNYDFYGQNIAGLKYTVNSIRGLKIQVLNDRQVVGYGDYQIGYQIFFNDATKERPIYVVNTEGYYEFDEALSIINSDSLVIQSLDGTDMEIMLDFIYELSVEDYEGKAVQEISYEKRVGQYAEFTAPNTSIYDCLFDKYYYDTDTSFRRLYNIWGITIEAEPGTKFEINNVLITINHTGIYNLYNLDEITSLKLVETSKGYDRQEVAFGTNVIVDYLCYIADGTYRQEA